MIVEQSNGVRVSIHPTESREIIFDSHVPVETNRMVSGKSLHQNLTVEDAKALRKALKQAIKEAQQ